MKSRILLLIFVLILSLSVTAVYAQDAAPEAEPAQEESWGGFLQSLFGEGSPLADVLPEGTDLDALVTAAGEQLGKAEAELGTAFSSIYEEAQSQGIDFSVDSLKNYAASFLAEMTGGGDLGFGMGLDDYLNTIDTIRRTEEQFYKDHNADVMDPGEVQVVSNLTLYLEEHPETADYLRMDTRTINYMTQLNFVRNEANQLVFVSGGSDVVMFTIQPDEAGNFSVVSAKFSEDGENYKPSIEAMLAEVGAPEMITEAMNQIEFGRVMVPFDLQKFLTDNPEYTAAEYGGEMRTPDELDTMWTEDMKVLFSDPAADPAPAE